jgi:hypothetical protein
MVRVELTDPFSCCWSGICTAQAHTTLLLLEACGVLLQSQMWTLLCTLCNEPSHCMSTAPDPASDTDAVVLTAW